MQHCLGPQHKLFTFGAGFAVCGAFSCCHASFQVIDTFVFGVSNDFQGVLAVERQSLAASVFVLALFVVIGVLDFSFSKRESITADDSSAVSTTASGSASSSFNFSFWRFYLPKSFS